MRRVGVALATAAVTAATLTTLHPAGASGVDTTCTLPLSKTDPTTVNVAFPDAAADYYAGAYTAVPGLRIRITGEYPHARYMSFNVYDSQLRPVDGAADVAISPDRGSANPFAGNADRRSAHRSYTAFIEFTAKPAKPAPNTMYVGATGGSPSPAGVFLYRIYIRDAGQEPTGGVALPTLTLEQDGTGASPAQSVCATFQRPPLSVLSGLNDAIAGSSGVAALDSAQPWGAPTPVWRRFVNLPTSFADFLTANPTGSPVRPVLDPVTAAGGKGGFLSNLDNAYVATAVNRRYGQVLVTRFKAPSFPDTRPGTARMPAGRQLRYWSLCENEFFTQRFVACSTDDRSVVDRQGYVTFVLSTAAARPASATAACGFTWLPWGADAEGVLIYRNMLPAKDFAAAIQHAVYESEKATMGAYLPVSRYYATTADFDAAARRTCS
jgi:hypothetical protein